MLTIGIVWFATIVVGAWVQTQILAPRQPY